MKDVTKFIYQCTQCGGEQTLDKQRLRDYIYADIYCPCCKRITSNLECGQCILDFYSSYDNTLDKRFFNYKNKTK